MARGVGKMASIDRHQACVRARHQARHQQRLAGACRSSGINIVGRSLFNAAWAHRRIFRAHGAASRNIIAASCGMARALSSSFAHGIACGFAACRRLHAALVSAGASFCGA